MADTAGWLGFLGDATDIVGKFMYQLPEAMEADTQIRNNALDNQEHAEGFRELGERIIADQGLMATLSSNYGVEQSRVAEMINSMNRDADANEDNEQFFSDMGGRWSAFIDGGFGKNDDPGQLMSLLTDAGVSGEGDAAAKSLAWRNTTRNNDFDAAMYQGYTSGGEDGSEAIAYTPQQVSELAREFGISNDDASMRGSYEDNETRGLEERRQRGMAVAVALATDRHGVKVPNMTAEEATEWLTDNGYAPDEIRDYLSLRVNNVSDADALRTKLENDLIIAKTNASDRSNTGSSSTSGSSTSNDDEEEAENTYAMSTARLKALDDRIATLRGTMTTLLNNKEDSDEKSATIDSYQATLDGLTVERSEEKANNDYLLTQPRHGVPASEQADTSKRLVISGQVADMRAAINVANNFGEAKEIANDAGYELLPSNNGVFDRNGTVILRKTQDPYLGELVKLELVSGNYFLRGDDDVPAQEASEQETETASTTSYQGLATPSTAGSSRTVEANDFLSGN